MVGANNNDYDSYIDNANTKASKMKNFTIKANGTADNKSKFFAEGANGKLLATICPRQNQSGSYSDRFMNVCFMDGSVEIADREGGEHETEHAADLIAAKLFS